jgi:hypothetical protein
MSVVTNVIVSGLGGFDPQHDHRVIDALHRFLKEHEIGGSLVHVGPGGGNRALERDIWVGAFNHLTIEKFVKAYQDSVKTLGRSIYSAQMLLCRQDDEVFEEVPQEDDGRIWHYRSAELDQRTE